MRALAEFIMRGRPQAALVATVGNLIPLISPATVALVSLRRSTYDGLLVALWALLPTLLLLAFSDVDPVLLGATMLVVIAVVMCAQVLRNTASWVATLASLVAASGAASLFAWQMAPDVVGAFTQQLNEVLERAASDANGSVALVTPVFFSGLIAYVIALHVLGSLILGRWWQATLYNPGGLREELHALRLPKMLAAGFALASLLCLSAGPDYVLWSNLLLLPLVVSGAAFVHYAVGAMGLGAFWLVLFYIGLVLIGPMSVLVTAVGMADSFMNLRARLPKKGSGDAQ